MAKIARLSTPARAKATAKGLAHFKRPDWELVRWRTMYALTKAKFTQLPRLQKQLLETGLREIIETSHDDDFWGVTTGGRGQNNMGKIIMQVREELRRKSNSRPIHS
jgi:ribA/ribD-fused uncharacterized protein